MRVTPVPISVLRASFVVGLVLLMVLCAIGQEQPKTADDKASITGTVTDPTQAVVPGAKVVLTGPAGLKKETQTDEKGAYSFTGLEAGIYTLTITAPNFAEKVLDSINLPGGLE